MKKILFALIVGLTSDAVATVKYTPLNIKAGLWEYENPTNKILQETMASMPKEFRSLIKSQIKHHKPIRACISTSDIKDPNHYIHKLKAKHCTIDVYKSTNSLLDGNLSCDKSNQKTLMDFTLDVINSKQVIIGSTIDTSDFSDGGTTNISSKALWKSDICPTSLKK